MRSRLHWSTILDGFAWVLHTVAEVIEELQQVVWDWG